MNQIYAYAHGALLKIAERQVTPAAFVQAAVQSRDPLAIKVANAIVEYEKVAGGLANVVRKAGLMNELPVDAARSLAGKIPASMGAGDHLGALGGMAMDAAKANPMAAAAAGTAGAAGLGGAGMYAAGPADTMENKLRGAVGMGQQSRIGNLLS